MRAVNLLPVTERARGPVAVPVRASHALIGVLALLVVAVLVVVLTQNQITAKKDEIAQAKTEQQAAQQRAAKLGSFGQFAKIKQTRVDSISKLAKDRFDYERLIRELALVLPGGTWVNQVSAASSGDPEGADGGTPASAPAAGATATAASPSVKILGCAKSQSKVAETMVRLGNLNRAQDVELADSTKAQSAGGASGGGGSSDSAGGGGDCGKNYAFDATVTFAPEPTPTDQGKREDKVPATLGGGS